MLMALLSFAALVVAAVIAHRSLTGKLVIDRAIEVSTVQVIGGEAGSFEGAAAILDSSIIIRAMQGLDEKAE